MSHSGDDSGAGQKFLHIKAIEITFKGDRPRYPVFVGLKSGENTRKSPRFARDETVSWKLGTGLHLPVPADLSIQVQEVHTLNRKKIVAVFNIPSADVVGKDSFEKEDAGEGSLVKLICISVLPTEEFAELLVNEAEDAIGNKKVLLESLGKVGKVLSTLMKFADLVSDLHPAAKAAVILVNALYEQCKLQQELQSTAAELMKDVSSFLPFVGDISYDLVKTERTKQIIKEMLELFCKISGVVYEYSVGSILGDLFSSRGDEIDSSKVELQRLKNVYDWCVKMEVWKSVIETEMRTEDIQIQQLHPARRAYYNMEELCLEGTRTAVLERVRGWAASESKLFWLHGVAGSGKSCIANSVAHIFDQEQRLLGCFFCKKDDPDCRVSDNIIPTLAFHFSKWHKSYRSAIASVIQGRDGPKLAQGLQWQFELLMKQPAVSLDAIPNDLPPRPLIVVIDALDECGDSPESRSKLAGVLAEMSALVPWLKVFVTSRPLPEFEEAFLRDAGQFQFLDINTEIDSEEVHGDILQYTRYRARNLGLTEGEISALASRASGLFIWTSTVFRFIGMQHDKKGAVLSISLSSPVDSQEAELDKVYTTVINAASAGPENTKIVRAILGFVSHLNETSPWEL
ncbi:hypothetical protein M0805_003161 [Coniferiporia weirii]|nr:hypothetical protein M0805_003161 [Coniferiporia weirii]